MTTHDTTDIIECTDPNGDSLRLFRSYHRAGLDAIRIPHSGDGSYTVHCYGERSITYKPKPFIVIRTGGEVVRRVI